MSIVPIPTTRVSDILVRQRLQSQLQGDQLALLRLQDQLSTGRRILLPSDDAPAALRGISLQNLLERKTQMRSNITTNETYLATADSTLGSAADLLTSIRASALAVAGTTSSDSQRAAVSLEIESAIRELINISNQQVGGRYLFAGSKVNERPYVLGNDTVSYFGDEKHVLSYGDLDLLFETNLTGDQVFGGISTQVLGSVDLNPSLSRDMLLTDLRGGLGINKSAISISDGTHTSLVDLSKANTVGDVVDLIEAGAPLGRTLNVDITATGLTVSIDTSGGGNLSIKDVGDGTTAADLGIARESLSGTTPIVGGDLNPRITLTTRLDQLLGSRASARVGPAGGGNNLVFTANSNGAQFNGVTISFVNGGLGTAGTETAVYNPGANTLTITIESGVSTANQVIAAVTAEGTFRAEVDSREPNNDGTGTILATLTDPTATGVTAGGSGTDLDRTSGIQVTNGGNSQTINFASAVTVEDLLNQLNGAGAGIAARLNADGSGIDLRTYLSGADFQIGENGGQTATQLGLRTFNLNTRLEDLNYGRGVQQTEGTDLVIQRRDGTQLNIDLAGASTIGDVIDRINNHPQNQVTATRVVASLATVGNGLVLTNDDATGTGSLSVIRVPQSQAAQDLGLIPVAGNSGGSTTPAAIASATLNPAGANNGITISGVNPGTQLNGVQISFVDTGLGAGNETVTYNAGAGTLVFDITSGVTTANDLVQLVNNDVTVSAVFNAALDPTDGTPNSGAGTYGLTTTGTLAGGVAEQLAGRDINPLEVNSAFNALLRLKTALKDNDEIGLQRALELLDQASFELNFARADSGARRQGLDLIKQRLDMEDTELRQSLSDNVNADFSDVVTELTARQTSFQAALQATAQTFKLSLLDYL